MAIWPFPLDGLIEVAKTWEPALVLLLPEASEEARLGDSVVMSELFVSGKPREPLTAPLPPEPGAMASLGDELPNADPFDAVRLARPPLKVPMLPDEVDRPAPPVAGA